MKQLDYFTQNEHFLYLERKIKSDYSQAHTHSFLEITFYKKAMGIDRINNTEHTVCPGALTIALPYQIHQVCLKQSPDMEYYTLCLSKPAMAYLEYPEKTLSSFIFSCITHENGCIYFENNTFDKLAELFETAVALVNKDDPFERLMLKGIFIEIMSIICSHWQASNGQKAPVGNNNENNVTLKENSLFWKIVEYINVNINRSLTTKFLAEKFNVSKSYISNNFKKYFGLTFRDYLNEIRIRNAEALLMSTDNSITDIAFTIIKGDALCLPVLPRLVFQSVAHCVF